MRGRDAAGQRGSRENREYWKQWIRKISNKKDWVKEGLKCLVIGDE